MVRGARPATMLTLLALLFAGTMSGLRVAPAGTQRPPLLAAKDTVAGVYQNRAADITSMVATSLYWDRIGPRGTPRAERLLAVTYVGRELQQAHWYYERLVVPPGARALNAELGMALRENDEALTAVRRAVETDGDVTAGMELHAAAAYLAYRLRSQLTIMFPIPLAANSSGGVAGT